MMEVGKDKDEFTVNDYDKFIHNISVEIEHLINGKKVRGETLSPEETLPLINLLTKKRDECIKRVSERDY